MSTGRGKGLVVVGNGEGGGGRTGTGDDDQADPFLRGHVGEGGLDIGGEAVAYCGGEVGEFVHCGGWGGGVGRWCARVVRGGEGSGVIIGVRWWEKVGRRKCREEDGSEPPWRVRNQNARKSCDAMRSGLPAVADECAGTDPTRCRRAWLALEGVR